MERGKGLTGSARGEEKEKGDLSETATRARQRKMDISGTIDVAHFSTVSLPSSSLELSLARHSFELRAEEKSSSSSSALSPVTLSHRDESFNVTQFSFEH